MKFYHMDARAIGGRQFPWASGYGPLGSKGEMPFLEGMPESFRATKLQSWKINKRPPGLEIDPGGRTWSDFIGCGASNPSQFVSERVIRDLREAGIPILRVTEMPIAKIAAKALQKITPPKYFVLEAEPGIARAWDAMGIPTDSAGKPILNPPPNPWPKAIYRLSSWKGQDLCCFSDGLATTFLICTDRVKELAENKGWTNVKFETVKVVE